MSRIELVEWLAMILIIVLWWPLVFTTWGPDWYRYPLIAFSVISLAAIFIRRMNLVREGFRISEQMMQARFEAERQARGGDPDLNERTPPDVLHQLPLPRPNGHDKRKR
jgi:hypothetical protein